MNKPYEVTYSPFRAFTREEWSKLEEHPMFPVYDIDLTPLQALNEPLTTDEIEDIYIPMVPCKSTYAPPQPAYRAGPVFPKQEHANPLYHRYCGKRGCRQEHHCKGIAKAALHDTRQPQCGTDPHRRIPLPQCRTQTEGDIQPQRISGELRRTASACLPCRRQIGTRSAQRPGLFTPLL